MPKALRADRRGLRIPATDVESSTVDICFDGHRVWSCRLPAPHPRSGTRSLTWPGAMVGYLHGTSSVSVRSSATGADIATGEIDFGGGGGRVAITDGQGRWQAMNKWNRLGPSFEGDSSGMQHRLLDASAKLAARMQEWSYPVYIVGGTLLGAMRSGSLLPHDDDTDFAFWCRETTPENVALVTFELERQLTGAGYTVVRHSHAHLEVVFLTEDGSTDYYIDIFAGYHSEDGLYNQPFALRDELALHDLLPTRMIDVSGVALPAPATPEAWLAYAYGEDWRVPDPSFRWQTPRETLRRFENGFGVFNRQRVFWEKTWADVDKRSAPVEGEYDDVDRFLRLLPARSFVLDLGCGDGRQAERIASAGHEVLAVDYSYEALRVARQTQPDGVEYRFLNLNDRHSLLELTLGLLSSGRQPYVFVRDVVHGVRPLGRADLWVMVRGLLDAQTFAYVTFETTPAARRIGSDPRTWTLAFATLRRETWRWKLGATVLARNTRVTPQGERTSLTTVIWK